MAKYSTALSSLIQSVAMTFDDLITGTPEAAFATTSFQCSTLLRASDFYNEWGLHFYSGTHKDITRAVSDWALAGALTFTPAVTGAVDATDLFQLHKLFSYDQYKNAVNRAIEIGKNSYLLNKVDATITQTHNDSLASAFTLGEDHFHVNTDTFPAAPFDVKIDEEIFNVTVKTSTNFTATAAQHGTTAASHSSGAAVQLEWNLKTEYSVPSGFVSIFKIVPEDDQYTDNYYDSSALGPKEWSIVKDPTTPKIRFADVIDSGCKYQLTGQAYQSALTLDASVCYMPPEYIIQQARGLLCMQRPQYKDMSAQAFSMANSIMRDESTTVMGGSRAVFEVG